MTSSSSLLPTKEYHFTVLGASEVGKTSILERLIGHSFNRKRQYRPSLEDDAIKYTVEVLVQTTSSSIGNLILFHFYDWAWEIKRINENINNKLSRGKDGAIFVYDCTDRRTYRDYAEYSDWYSRASGYDKPWLFISNKNDQKKKAVQDGEGEALARGGERRGYVPISLVDDTGIDDVILTLSRIMVGDLNLNVSSFGAASESSLQWSNERDAALVSRIGLEVSDLPTPKTHRVLIVALNSSIVEKFTENLQDSEYIPEGVGSPDICLSEITSPEDPNSLPVGAIVAPPTISDSQKRRLTEIAQQHDLIFVVSIPRNALDSIHSALSSKPHATEEISSQQG